MVTLGFITVLPMHHRYCTFAPGLQQREAQTTSKATRKIPLHRLNINVVSCSGETPQSTANDDYEKLAQLLGFEGKRSQSYQRNVPNSRSGVEDLIMESDDTTTKAKLLEEAKQRARMYSEMAESLGPPSGKFKRNDDVKDNSKDTKTNAVESVPTSLPPTSNTVPNKSSDSDRIESEPMKKEARTFEEEYQLFDSMLRGGAKSNKPRKGRQRYVSRDNVLGEFVTEPWRTSYNLMPKKSARRKKGETPKKAPPSVKNPKDVEISLEGIDQSYWALEKVLDDEDRDWELEQNRLMRIGEQKRRAHNERRMLKKAARKANNSSPINSSNINQDKSSESDSLPTLDVEQERLSKVTTNTDSANLMGKATSPEVPKPDAEQRMQEEDHLDFMPPNRSETASMTESVPPYWTLNPPIQRKAKSPGIFNSPVFASPLPLYADSEEPADDEVDESIESRPVSVKPVPTVQRVAPKKRRSGLLKLSHPKVWN